MIPPTAPGGPARPLPPELAELRPARPAPRLHRPRRMVVLAVELAAAVLFGAGVLLAWQRGMVPYELPASDNPAVPDEVDRRSGPWLGVAFVLAAGAGLLLLDAIRQAVLASRVNEQHGQRPPDPDQPADGAGETSEADQANQANETGEVGEAGENGDGAAEGGAADRG